MKIGIVGLPNVGKSTLFNAITSKSVPAENFPFCTIDPSVGIVEVPDNRLAQLSEMSKTEKIVPATVEFVDIAGLVEGASKGEGLGNQFLANIRECDAIAEVVRVFDDEDIIHVNGAVNPLHDIEIINMELIFADMETVSKRKEKLAKDIKRGDKDALALDEILEKISQTLAAGKLANTTQLTDKESELIKGLHLLTMKPFMYILNHKTDTLHISDQQDTRHTELMHFLDKEGVTFVQVDAGVEYELKDVHPDEEEDFRRELGVLENGINAIIRTGYDLLGLISFFTTGVKETRSWTIKKGSTAPEAGAAIHTDFRDKFIRAQVIEWDKMIEAGSRAQARDQGLIRTEGKDYIVKDGDVIEFMHS